MAASALTHGELNMGLLGDLYSTIDTKKRQLKGLLADPLGTIDMGVRNFGEDQSNLINLFRNAYPMAGDKTVLNSPQQIAQFRGELADKSAAQAMAGAVYVGKNKIADRAFHGAGDDFARFSEDRLGSAHADQNGAYWLTDDWGHARGYSVSANPQNKTRPNVKEGNVFLKNPRQVDAMESAKSVADDVGVPHPKDWQEASELLDYNSWVSDQLRLAKKSGNDGVIFNNTGDAPGTAGGLATHYAIFNKNRVRFSP